MLLCNMISRKQDSPTYNYCENYNHKEYQKIYTHILNTHILTQIVPRTTIVRTN